MGSEYDVTDLATAKEAAAKKKTLMFSGSLGSDPSAENIQLAFKLVFSKLRIEEILLTFTKKKSQ